MGRKSTIKTLPPELLEKLQEWLKDPSVTIEDATNMLNELLEPLGETRSKSAVGRYSIEMSEIGKEIEESREIAKMMMGKLGNERQSELGSLINEMVRNLIFKLSVQLNKTGEAESKDLKDLATAIEKLEKATQTNQKIREDIEKAVLEKASEKTEKLVTEAGLSKDTVKMIKNQILGLNNV